MPYSIGRIFLSFMICVLCCSASTCDKPITNTLVFIEKHFIDIDEPSGLAMDPDGEHLWIVSDQDDDLYKTDLTGKIIEKTDIPKGDYEGVAITADGQTLYLLDESENEILIWRLDDGKQDKIKLTEKSSKKSGPEGIDIDWSTDEIYVVNEKNPRTLHILELDGAQKKRQEITALSDMSAVCVNPENKELWILSDEDGLLIRANPDYSVVSSFSVPIEQPEGLAINFNKNRIYIVSDAEEMLYIFEYK